MTNKKRIAILEFDYHDEVLRNTLLIFSKLDYDIEVYSTDSIWEKVKLPQQSFYTTFTCSKSNIKKFIISHLQRINLNDLIIFNTIASNFKLFSKVTFEKPVVVRVHNANFTLRPCKNLYPKLTPFFIWKHTSYILTHLFLRLDLIYKPKFFKRQVNYYSFPNNEIKTYLIESNIIEAEKTLGNFPFIFNDISRRKPQKKDGQITISVIGTLDKRRRDYTLIYNALSVAMTKYTGKVELKLLGKPLGAYGKRIIKLFKDLENDSFKLTAYDRFIPQDEFEMHIDQTDFLIITVPEKTHYKIYKELYGKTKISGNITDMVIYNKPAILPGYYLLSPILQEVTCQYNSLEELANTLFHWFSTKEYEKFNFSNIEADFSIEKIAQTVKNSLDEIMGSKLS